jgi:hypothetical protein
MADFSPLEIRMLMSMVHKKPDDEIAFVLDRPVEEIAAKVLDLTGGLNKAVVKIKAPKTARLPKVKQQRAPRKRKKKELTEGERLRLLARQQRKETAVRRKANEEPKFQTKKVDYSQLTAIRIDAKTIVYAKPGEDPEEVRKKYFRNHKKKTTL